MVVAILILSILLAVTFVRIGQALFASPYNPFGLFGAVWTITLGVFATGLVNYIQVHVDIWTIVLGSCCSFLAGCLISFSVGAPSEVRRTTVDTYERDALRSIILFCCPLGLLGFAFYLSVVDKYVGLQAYIDAPYLVRELQSSERFAQDFAGVRHLNYINISNVAFSSYWLARYGDQRGAALVKVSGVLALLTTFGAADRTFPFAAISWAFFVHEHAVFQPGASRRSSIIRLAVLSVSLIVLFLVVAEWLGKTVDNNIDIQRHTSPDVPTWLKSAMMPYVYLTGNIPAFQEFVRHHDGSSTSGVLLFLPLAKIARIFNPTIEIPGEIREYEQIPFQFNTMTWLDSFWLDFGLAGVLLAPFFLGFLFTWISKRTVASPNFTNVLLLGLCCYVVINSVFVNKISSTPTWQFIGMIGVFGAWMNYRASSREIS